MTNIHEILKSYGVEIPSDKKADFDKALNENYKTIAEVDKINDKLTKANNDLSETKKHSKTPIIIQCPPFDIQAVGYIKEQTKYASCRVWFDGEEKYARHCLLCSLLNYASNLENVN